MSLSDLSLQVGMLQSKADELLHLGDAGGFVYADDLARLNREIHGLVEELWSKEGTNLRENAELCLALLSGCSGCMYAAPDDENRRSALFSRTRQVLAALPASQLKDRLSAALHNLL